MLLTWGFDVRLYVVHRVSSYYEYQCSVSDIPYCYIYIAAVCAAVVPKQKEHSLIVSFIYSNKKRRGVINYSIIRLRGLRVQL